jgi:predicted RNA binding protein YcfA (HicA-like mRNA interferase family)
VSPRAPRLTADELLRALRRDGWEILRQRGSHTILTHSTKPGHPVVAVHAGLIISPKTLAGILADAGLTSDELRELL